MPYYKVRVDTSATTWEVGTPEEAVKRMAADFQVDLFTFVVEEFFEEEETPFRTLWMRLEGDAVTHHCCDTEYHQD